MFTNFSLIFHASKNILLQEEMRNVKECVLCILYKKRERAMPKKNESEMLKRGDVFHIGEVCPESGVYRLNRTYASK